LTAYIIRRLLYTIPQVLGICFITFLLFEVLYTPETRATQDLGKGATPVAVAETILTRGWGKPLFYNSTSSLLSEDDVLHWDKLATALAAAGDAVEKADADAATEADRKAAATPIAHIWKRLPKDALTAVAELKKLADDEDSDSDPEAQKAVKSNVTALVAALNMFVVAPRAATGSEYYYQVFAAVAPIPWIRRMGEGIDAESPDADEPAGARRKSRLEKEAMRELAEDSRLAHAEPKGLSASQTQRLNRLAVDMGLHGMVAGRYYSHCSGLTRLVRTRFVDHLRKLLLFDFGISDKTSESIGGTILRGMGPSLTLTVPIFVMSLILGISLSLIVAYFRGSYLDTCATITCVFLMSISVLVYIIAGQYLAGIHLRLFPSYGFAPDIRVMQFVMLPIGISLFKGLGGNVRFYRTILGEEMGQDYVRTARAKGLSERVVLFKHVLKNAMIPVLTRTVMAIPFLFLGSLLLENFFGIPGLGNMTIQAINNGDFQVVIAMVYLSALLFALGNLLTDISYTFVDPRVKLR
jgi:peptide/nickel transport system permease protein